MTTKIEVTIRSVTERPSGHKPTAFFAGGIDYKETFSCKHSRKHALLFMKVLDLSANQCGIDSKEFPSDSHFTSEMNKLVQQIESLHHLTKQQQTPQQTCLSRTTLKVEDDVQSKVKT